MRKSIRWPLAALLLVPAAAAAAGGWATITVHDLPESMRAGEPVSLQFTVRQHGVETMNDLAPRITARSGTHEITTAARRTGDGVYAASVAVPAAGEWSLSIGSGFGESNVTLLPITAHAPGAQPVRQSLSARGRNLFVAKGCLSCHRHADVEASKRGSGPELTARRYDAGWLARFLDDPSIRPPADPRNRMPALELSPAEIAALVTFINADGARTAAR